MNIDQSVCLSVCLFGFVFYIQSGSERFVKAFGGEEKWAVEMGGRNEESPWPERRTWVYVYVYVYIQPYIHVHMPIPCTHTRIKHSVYARMHAYIYVHIHLYIYNTYKDMCHLVFSMRICISHAIWIHPYYAVHQPPHYIQSFYYLLEFPHWRSMGISLLLPNTSEESTNPTQEIYCISLDDKYTYWDCWTLIGMRSSYGWGSYQYICLKCNVNMLSWIGD